MITVLEQLLLISTSLSGFLNKSLIFNSVGIFRILIPRCWWIILFHEVFNNYRQLFMLVSSSLKSCFLFFRNTIIQQTVKWSIIKGGFMCMCAKSNRYIVCNVSFFITLGPSRIQLWIVTCNRFFNKLLNILFFQGFTRVIQK